MYGHIPGFVLLMNFFTSCWSAIPAHVHLFVHPYWESFCLGMLHLGVVQRGLPPTSRTGHQTPLFSISVSPRVMASSGRGGL